MTRSMHLPIISVQDTNIYRCISWMAHVATNCGRSAVEHTPMWNPCQAGFVLFFALHERDDGQSMAKTFTAW